MAIVVSPTNPFPSSTLSLHSPSRWPSLLPLLRPFVKHASLPGGEKILVDAAVARTTKLHVVATSKAGEFSSVVLDGANVSAVLSGVKADGVLDVGGIREAIAGVEGVGNDCGVVVVKAGTKRRVVNHASFGVEIEVPTAVERDHVLRLLSSAKEECRTSLPKTEELLRVFVDGAVLVQSRFEAEKVDGKPALSGANRSYGFESAREVVGKEVEAAVEKLGKKSRGEGVVYSVHLADVNGLSRLEDYIVAGEVARCFESKGLPFRLSHSSVLDHENAARGFAISVYPTSSTYIAAQPTPKPYKSSTSPATSPTQHSTLTSSKITFNDTSIRAVILAGCEAVISAEPKITEYDTIVGDGDCGYTLRDGALLVKSFIADKDLSHLPSVVADLVADLEVSMGGTSGALYCIFLTALATALAAESSVPKALESALGVLEKFTNARVGDRTMMDALIPFVRALAGGEGVEVAVRKAKEGVKGTKKMEARLGRSAYLDDSATQGVPDPGAYGLGVLLEAMAGAL